METGALPKTTEMGALPKNTEMELEIASTARSVPPLPVEIWQMILDTSQDELDTVHLLDSGRAESKHLPDKLIKEFTLHPKWPSWTSLLSLRLVNKLFNTIISEIAFQRIIFRAETCNLDSLQNLVRAQRENIRYYACYIFIMFESVDYEEDVVLNHYWRKVAEDPFKPPVHNPPFPTTKFDPLYSDLVMDVFEKQLELQTSGTLHSFHANELATLPNLEEIVVLFNSLRDETSRTLQIPPCTWLPILFKACVRSMFDRIGKGFKPVKKFTFDCLTDACFFMSRAEIQLLPKAFENLTSLTLEIYVCDRLDEDEQESPGMFEPLSIILASAKHLETLDLHCMTESGEGFDSRSIGTNLLNPRMLTPAQWEELWPQLKVLSLESFDFPVHVLRPLLLRILPHLESLTFEDCALKQDPIRGPIQAGLNWHVLLKEMKTQMETLKISKIETVNLTNLHSGDDGHDHMSNKELRAWENWLMGEREVEPEHRTDKIVPNWCMMCQGFYGDAEIESDSEDGSYMDDYGDYEDDEDDDEDEDDDDDDEDGENEWEDMDEDDA